MPWRNDQAAREASTRTYGAEWRKVRQQALERATHRCEQCGSRRRLQVDHVTPVSQGGTHSLANLMVLCSGPGSCHAQKTASEGGGYRSGTARDPDPLPRTSW